MYAIDENGVTGEAVRLVQPKMVSVVIDSSPADMQIAVDGEPLFGLTLVDSWQNHEMSLEAVDDPPLKFLIWSDGVSSAKRSVPLTNSKSFYAAIFCVEDGGSCDQQSSAAAKALVIANTERVCCAGRCNADGFCEKNEAAVATPPAIRPCRPASA